jgi:hypothetical protein
MQYLEALDRPYGVATKSADSKALDQAKGWWTHASAAHTALSFPALIRIGVTGYEVSALGRGKALRSG